MKGVSNVTKPLCQIAGTEGNVYALIGKVSDALEGANQSDRIGEFVKRSMTASTYDELLGLSQDYVEHE